MIELIGFTAAILTTIAYLPQVIKTWKSKSAADLSLGLFSILSTGVFLWLVYGIMIVNWPIIASNAITLILTSSMLYFKLRYK
ncbi:MAG: SemiSWEET transporter [Bacteroidia bacterium]|nr:SemiSWEET transporter [Bacteroidia bacterium]